MVDVQSATADNKRGKKKKEERKKIDTTAAKYCGLPYWAAIITLTFLKRHQQHHGLAHYHGNDPCS